MNEFGECVGVDPMTRQDVREMVARARVGGFGEMKVFTLVDTYTADGDHVHCCASSGRCVTLWTQRRHAEGGNAFL
jgi:hypothetical protein